MTEMVLSDEHETIAQVMLETRGDLALASRSGQVPYNAMALRNVVRTNPVIRNRYHELLAYEMQEKGLHIAERILKMVELQDAAFGTDELPADPKMAIELSKEISRLIAEGKGQSMSSKQTILIASKLDAKELLDKFLDS